MRRFVPIALLTTTLATGWTMSSSSQGQPSMTYPTIGSIVREDPRLDSLLPLDAKIEVLASGFEWSEGPVWVRSGGYLLFSDIPNNVIHKWQESEGLSTYMKPSGFTGVGSYSKEPGSNGLTLDAQGRLILCEHGDRRVARLEPGGGKYTLADQYQGKRLNSPNDVIVKSNGDVYFTDPPYGLPKRADDPARELDFYGVYRVSPRDRTVTLLTKELKRPNGLAFSPDEKILYVAQSDAVAIWTAYPVLADGTLGPGRVLADVSAMMGKLKGAPDGLKVDRDGNLWATGPGGVHVMTPDGKRLGRIDTGEATANCAWGDDGSTLYITADMYLCRIRTKTKGAGW
jgi:gluconolactonase